MRALSSHPELGLVWTFGFFDGMVGFPRRGVAFIPGFVPVHAVGPSRIPNLAAKGSVAFVLCSTADKNSISMNL